MLLDTDPDAGGELVVDEDCAASLTAPVGVHLTVGGWLDRAGESAIVVRPEGEEDFVMEVLLEVPAAAWTGPGLPDGATKVELVSRSGSYDAWGSLTAVAPGAEVVLLAWDTSGR